MAHKIFVERQARLANWQVLGVHLTDVMSIYSGVPFIIQDGRIVGNLYDFR